MFKLHTTIFGGLPINIEFSIESDDPEVGFVGGNVDEWYVTHIAARKVKNPKWLYNKLDKNPKDFDKLMEECKIYANEQATDPHDYY
jgi:hypothetical protein